MLSAIVALSLLSVSGEIEFDHAGAPVQRVVEAMGAAYGQACTTDGSLRDDIVILALRSADFEAAKSLVADTLRASWTEKDGKWLLARSAEQAEGDKSAEIAYRAKLIAEEQAQAVIPARLDTSEADEYIREVALAATRSDDDYQAREKIESKAPGYRAAQRLLLCFEPSELAKLPPSIFVPFTIGGVKGCRALPKKATSVLEEFAQDHKALRDLFALKAATLELPWSLRELRLDPREFFVAMERSGTTVYCYLIVPSLDGGQNQQFPAYLPNPRFEVPTLLSWPAGSDSPFTLSNLAKERIALRPVWNSNFSQVLQPSKELLNVYMSPRAHDLWELAPSEIVRQAADATRKSICVLTIDTFVGQDLRLQRGSQTVRAAIETLFPQAYYNVTIDQCIVIRPHEPNEARAGRIGRIELGRALSSLRSREDALDNLAELALTSFPNVGLPTTTLSGLSGAVLSRFGYGGEPTLVIYGGLNETQRNAASSAGVVLDPGRLGLESQLALGHLFAALVMQDSPDYLDRIEPDWEKRQERYAQILRFGLAGVSIKVKKVHLRSLFLKGAEATSSVPIQPTSVANQGRLQASAEKFGFDDEPYLYRATEETGVLLSLVRGGEEFFLDSYFAPAIYAGDKFVPIEKLPESYLAEIKEAYEAEKKRLANIPPH